MSPAPCALYRHFDAKGRLLYVGISSDPLRRLRQHMRRADWRSNIAKITIQRYRSRGEALAAEVEAIRSERPKHNIAHRPLRKSAARNRAHKPTRLLGTEADHLAYREAMDGLLHPARIRAIP